MGITLTFGWWIAPFVVSLALFAIWLASREPGARIGYSADMAYGLILSNVALAAWLIWAILT